MSEQLLSQGDGSRGAPEEPARHAGSQSFARGLRILETLATHEGSLSTAELATAVGISRQAVYRVLHTLEEFGYLKTDPSGNKFSLSLRLLSLSRHVNAQLRAHLSPQVQLLAEQAGATAIVGISEGTDVVCFIAKEPPETVVSIRYREGIRRSKQLGASGKVIRFLENSESDDPGVRQVSTQGYATSSGELEMKTSAVSVPLKLVDPSINACLTLIFPSLEIEWDPAVLDLLRTSADRMSSGIAFT